MSKRIIAIICLLALLLGFIPAAAIVASAEGEGQYQVGYAKLNINPYIQGANTNGLGIADTSYSDEATYVGTTTISTGSVKFVKIPLGGYGNAKTRLATEFCDDNGDGKITLDDGLFTTATAVTDRNGNAVIFITLDTISMTETVNDDIRHKIVEQLKGKVNADSIIVSGSHTHEGPDLDMLTDADSGTALAAYYQYMLTQVTNAAVQAYNSKSNATVSKGQIDASDTMAEMRYTYSNGTGYKMNFNRHYNETVSGTSFIVGDNFSGNKNDEPDSHVLEANDVMQVLKFDFADAAKADVLMVGWQSHASIIGSAGRTHISSDYVNALRKYLEDKGYSAAFWQGTAGNNNPTTYIASEAQVGIWNHYGYGSIRPTEVKGAEPSDYNDAFQRNRYQSALYGCLLGKIAERCQMEAVDQGDIRVMPINFRVKHREYSSDWETVATRWKTAVGSGSVSYPWTTTVNGTTYAVNSELHGNWLYLTATNADWQGEITSESNLALNVITLGSNVAILTCSGELFDNYDLAGSKAAADNDWVELENALAGTYGKPFVVGYTQKNTGYLPNALTYTYKTTKATTVSGGGYEANTSRYDSGTGESVVAKFQSALQSLDSLRVAKCRQCNEIVSWTPVNAENGDLQLYTGHYYMTDDIILDSYSSTKNVGVGYYDKNAAGVQYTTNAALYAKDVCLDLNGHTLKTSGRAFYLGAYSTLNILDTAGGGQVISTASSNSPVGGVINTNIHSVLNLYGGTYSYQCDPGKSKVSAGGIVALQGTMNLYDGATIVGAEMTNTYSGSALGSGVGGAIGVFSTNNTFLNIYGGTVLSGSLPSSVGAKEPYNMGACIFGKGNGIISVSGNANIEELYYYQNGGTRLKINDKFTGTLNLTLDPTEMPVTGVDASRDIGDATAKTDISMAEITCNGIGGICVDGTNLRVVMPGENDVVMGNTAKGAKLYTSLAEAAATNTGVLKLFKDISNQQLNNNARIDLAGYSINGLNIRNGQKLYAMDSANDDYDGYGSVTVTSESMANQIVPMPTDLGVTENTYVKYTNGGEVSIHRVDMEIVSMTTRTEEKDAQGNIKSVLNLQYNCIFNGDERASAAIDKYGVVAGINNEPTALTDTNSSKYDGATLVNGEANSTWIYNIVKSGAANVDKNNKNAKVQIYGKPYIKLKNGEVFYGECVNRSLLEQMELTDAMWTKLNFPQKNGLANVYETYKDTLTQWTVPNLKGFAGYNDDVIKILEIGNSHGLDSTNLLIEVIKDQNPNAQVVVGALYYSGCRIDMHLDYMTNNKAEYDYYKNATFATTGVNSSLNSDGTRSWKVNFGTGAIKDGGTGTTAYKALQDEDWDIITLQQMSHWSAVDSWFKDEEISAVVNYIKTNKKNPEHKPVMMWNMVWANPSHEGAKGDNYWLDQLDSWKSNNTAYAKDANGNYDMDIQFANIYRCAQKYIMSRGDFVDILPVGTVIQYAKNNLGYAQTQLYRDYTHVTDYGRLMAAYVWYAKIFGVTSISEVGINQISTKLKHPNSPYPSDNIITADMKADLIEAVNWAINNPYSIG